MNISIAQSLVFVVAGTLAQAAPAAETANSINFGIGGLNPMPHCDALIYTVEYEHKYSPTIAILGRASRVDYTSDDTDYLEDGRLQGLDLGFRYYRAGRRQGFYTGGSLGYWTDDWTFTQYRSTPSQREGAADSRSLRVNIDLGYRFPIRDSNVSINPEVNMGKFFSSTSCDFTAPPSVVGAACDQTSEVNYYLFAGVTVGVAF